MIKILGKIARFIVKCPFFLQKKLTARLLTYYARQDVLSVDEVAKTAGSRIAAFCEEYETKWVDPDPLALIGIKRRTDRRMKRSVMSKIG